MKNGYKYGLIVLAMAFIYNCVGASEATSQGGARTFHNQTDMTITSASFYSPDKQGQEEYAFPFSFSIQNALKPREARLIFIPEFNKELFFEFETLDKKQGAVDGIVIPSDAKIVLFQTSKQEFILDVISQSSKQAKRYTSELKDIRGEN